MRLLTNGHSVTLVIAAFVTQGFSLSHASLPPLSWVLIHSVAFILRSMWQLEIYAAVCVCVVVICAGLNSVPPKFRSTQNLRM